MTIDLRVKIRGNNRLEYIMFVQRKSHVCFPYPLVYSYAVVTFDLFNSLISVYLQMFKIQKIHSISYAHIIYLHIYSMVENDEGQ